MVKVITIKDFKGVNLKEGLWDQGFSKYNRGMDLWGLGDNPSKVSYPGVIQKAMGLASMTISAGGYTLASVLADFAKFTHDGFIYGIDTVSASHIYRLSTAASQWQYVSAINVSGIGSNMASYNDNLFYSTNNYLGKYDGTNGNANFQQFSSSNQYPRPLKVFAGSLFAGNGRYVDKYDGTTYQSQKLTLPLDFVVVSMEVFREYLYISADNDQYTRVFIWDGSSPTYNDSFTLWDESFAPSMIATPEFLWLVGNRSFTNSTTITTLTPIYAFQYGAPELVARLPLRRQNSVGLTSPMSGLAVYQNGILIASSEGSSANSLYEDGVGGVWYVGKDIQTGLYSAGLMLTPGNLPYQSNPGAIYTGGANPLASPQYPAVFVSLDNTIAGHSYEIHQIQPATNGTSSQWFSLPIDAGSTNDKSWSHLKINFEALQTNQRVIIYASFDDPTSFPRTGTVQLHQFLSTDASTDRMMFVRIGRTSRTLHLIITCDTLGATESTRIHSVDVFYDPTGN